MEIDKDKSDNDRTLLSTRTVNGEEKTYVTVQFRVTRADGTGEPAGDIHKDWFLVKEGVVGQDRWLPVEELEIYRPRGFDPLSAVLAMDISGSMTEHGKMAKAKEAARFFLGKLHAQADCGLILFDHEIRTAIPPSGNSAAVAEHRQRLVKEIDAAEPLGGTAWLDAAARGIDMLRHAYGRRVLVVMTDGVDLNSRHTLEQVILLAQEHKVQVYTLGIGETGKSDLLSTVLVLDHSGSMEERADDNDATNKITAMHRAAVRFIDLMRSNARTTLLPFSDEPDTPEPFTNDKPRLKKNIEALEPDGETALYHAIYDALGTLTTDADLMRQAGQDPGKRAVVVLTDGIDNKSRPHRPEGLIQQAKQFGIPLYILGLGRKGELDEATMDRMAKETGGRYYHAQRQQQLLEIFESLSIQLHDDGIDEASLRRLAEETGGRYIPVRDVNDLERAYREVAEELDSAYTATFRSPRPKADGTIRRIKIVIHDGRRPLSEEVTTGYHTSGVVVPQLHAGVYLGLLAMLGSLLVLPLGIRRLYRFYGGG